jgi:hypothetical protein
MKFFMKSTLITLLLAIGVASHARSQPGKGGWMLGAEVSRSLLHDGGLWNSVAKMPVTIRAGYSLSDRWQIGVSGSYALRKIRPYPAGAGNMNTVRMAIQPNARLFLGKKISSEKPIRTYVEIGGGPGITRYMRTIPGEASSYQIEGFTTYVQPGALFFFTDKVAMQMHLHFESSSFSDIDNSLAMHAGAGFQVFLHCKKRAGKIEE